MKQSRFILRGYGHVDILSTVVFSVTPQQTIRSFPFQSYCLVIGCGV
jgi:hypothetical protein